MTSKIVVNNIEADAGISSVTFTSDIELGTKNLKGHNLESTGIVTAVSFTGSGANLTNLPAGNLSGTLPALDGSNLTGVGASFGNSSVNTSGIITATAFVSDTPLSHRNLIVNGDMNVAQRGQVTGLGHASGGAGGGFGGPDRFAFYSNYSIVTMSQSTDVPSGQGFAKSLKLDVTTAGGDSNADTYTQLDYRFEGQELTRLKYGTSDAETTTISFWIKSPKAGIHWVRLYGDELSGNAFISRKYTVTSANTWQKVILSFPGYTGSGFNNDNTLGMRISIYFAQGSAYSSGTAQADDGGWLSWTESAAVRSRNTVGQVNCFDSTSNDIYITGVQFEVGPVATPFEHISIAENKRRCYRYCQRGRHISSCLVGTPGTYYFSRGYINLFTPMRAAVTGTLKAATWNLNRYFQYMTWSSGTNVTAAPASVTFSSLSISDASSDIVGCVLHISISSGSSNSPLPANGPGSNNVYPIEYYDVLLEAEL